MSLSQLLRGIARTAAIFTLSLGVTSAFAQATPKTIIFGVAPGPYGDLIKQAIQPGLEKKGYKIVVKEFSDYVQPNLALANGATDANLFQHKVYLDKFSADKGLKLSALINVPTAGLGIYSSKTKSLDDLKKGDIITLANDPTNLARALRFLAKLNLLTFKSDIDPTKASEKDIDQNPRGLASRDHLPDPRRTEQPCADCGEVRHRRTVAKGCPRPLSKAGGAGAALE